MRFVFFVSPFCHHTFLNGVKQRVCVCVCVCVLLFL